MIAKLHMRKKESAFFMIKKMAGGPRTHVVKCIRKRLRVTEADVPPEIAVQTVLYGRLRYFRKSRQKQMRKLGGITNLVSHAPFS